jgi:hypothetical protein
MTLGQQEIKWIRLHDRFQTTCPVNCDQLAAPFLSVPDPTDSDPLAPAVLFVGKATRGDWFANSYVDSRSRTAQSRLKERRGVTTDFLKNPAFERYRSSGFWQMWKRVKALTGGAVIWSNVAKIGTKQGNPSWQLVEAEADLAIATLKAEVAHYRPRLIIFVTGEFARFEVVTKLLGVPKETSQDKHGIFLRRRGEPRNPAVLWTGHPERRDGDTIDRWLKEVRGLLR